MEWTQIVIAAIGGGGLATVLGALVNGAFTKRKFDSEATEIITKAATGVVGELRTEVERLQEQRRSDRDRFNSMIRTWDAEREEWRRVLQLHVTWDMIAITEVAKVGIQLPPAPPLYPPNPTEPTTHQINDTLH